jgi:mannose-1-phosphate guanylyltransferase
VRPRSAPEAEPAELAAFLQQRATMTHTTWSVVLAAGKGRRLSPLTGGTPKQFWCPGGASSLLDQTLARLASLSPPARTVIVVDESHRGHLAARPQYAERGQVLFQPTDRGTAVGVLFGLMPVLAADPEATVLLSPSDHGVGNVATFRRGVIEAIECVQMVGGVVLLAVEPSSARDDYGWITFGPERGTGGFRTVAGFVEKPAQAVARGLLKAGAVWNTMVLVAQVKDLVALFALHLPRITATFLQSVATPAKSRPAFFRELYSRLPAADFSRDVLARARGLVACTWPSTMGWSDLGTPERLNAWLRPASARGTPTMDPHRAAHPIGRVLIDCPARP